MVAVILLASFGCGKIPKDAAIRLKVMAPDYLKEILDRAAAQFKTENRIQVNIVYEKGENIIGRIKADENVDAFITYNHLRFENLRKDSLIIGDFTCPFKLSLVLAGPAGGGRSVSIDRLEEDHIRRVVIVDPEAGYEGQLAKKVLESKKLWKKLKNKLILARSSEHLMTYLAAGEADAAIMLESSIDLRADVAVFQNLSKRVDKYLRHCGAVGINSKHEESARAFLDLLDSRLCDIYKIEGVYQESDR